MGARLIEILIPGKHVFLVLPLLDRLLGIDKQQTDDASNQVVDITETPGLLALAEDAQRFPLQRLYYEIGDHSTVICPHTRTEGIEDANNPRIESMIPVIRHGHGLGKPFRLVVDAAWTDWIDVAPIRFRLWVDQRVAIDF